jgi:hypothetical protein
MGSLYRPKLRNGARGTIWRAKYYQNGRPIRESTGTRSRKEAERFLKEREGRVAAGLPLLPRADKVRYEEAAENLRQHDRTTGSRDLAEAEKRLKHLDRFFAGRRLTSIGAAEATAYVAGRQAQNRANGTINENWRC